MAGSFIKYWLPLLVCMFMIFGASTSLGRPENTSRFIVPFLLWLNPNMTPATIDKVHYAIRKLAHFSEYGVLGLLLWRLVNFKLAPTAYRSWNFAITLLFAALYASSDEFHQSFVPGRHPSVYDVLLDTCGAGFALAVIWTVRRLRHKN